MLKAFDPARCPVDQALELIGGKWKARILWRLSSGTLRFSELQRALAGVSQRMLTLQLREMQRDGLVTRTVYAEVPPRVEYTLTGPARALLPMLRPLGDWFVQQHPALQASASVPDPRETRPEPNYGGNVRTIRAR